MMRLYHYDHCPFCVRARMIIGLRGLNVEQIALANDDEATPIGLVGKKMVPILIKEDGTAMGESLDIVRYLDEYAGKERLDETIRPEVQAWLNQVNEYSGQLLSPRSTRIGLPEFATESARAYYTAKKKRAIRRFCGKPRAHGRTARPPARRPARAAAANYQPRPSRRALGL